MENMTNQESLYFDPATGKLCTSRPTNDKAIAVDMNKQGSGGFFSCSVKEARDCFMSLTLLGDVVEGFLRNKCRIDAFLWISCCSL